MILQELKNNLKTARVGGTNWIPIMFLRNLSGFDFDDFSKWFEGKTGAIHNGVFCVYDYDVITYYKSKLNANSISR